MGKRTRGATLPVLGTLFIAGGFYAAIAAAAPVIQVGTGSGSAGGTATFSVTLSAGGAQVAATENDISFDAQTPVAVSTAGHCAITIATACTATANCPVLPAPFTNEACVSGHCATTTTTTCTTSADCPTVKEPCIAEGGPACTVNSAIGKQGFFSFLPNFCSNSPTTPCASDADCPSQVVGSCSVKCSGATCTSMRALVFAVNNFDAIPDGSTLYSCNVAIASGASGEKTLTVGNVSAGDTNKVLISGVTGTSGKITVSGVQSYTVCDVNRATAQQTGDDVGDFGDGSIDIFDVRAIFAAAQLSIDAPADGTARFSAMDSVTVDTPTTCGGDGSLDIFDVRQCFAVGQLGATNYVRTGTGASCTSAVQPQ